MHLYAFVCICMHLYAFVCICIVHLYASNVYVFVCFMMFYVHTFSTFASLRSFESAFSLPKRIGICSSAHCHPGHRGCGSRKTSSAPKHRSSGRWRSSGCRRWCRSTWEHRGDPDRESRQSNRIYERQSSIPAFSIIFSDFKTVASTKTKINPETSEIHVEFM